MVPLPGNRRRKTTLIPILLAASFLGLLLGSGADVRHDSVILIVLAPTGWTLIRNVGIDCSNPSCNPPFM